MSNRYIREMEEARRLALKAFSQRLCVGDKVVRVGGTTHVGTVAGIDGDTVWVWWGKDMPAFPSRQRRSEGFCDYPIHELDIYHN